jgi:hypothetical protein
MSEKFSRREIVTWETQLQRAYTAEDVLAIVKDFLATWSPSEVGAMPEHLRPGRLRDSDDVALYAFRLMSLPRSGVNSHILHRMTTFFTAASHRLSQILAIAAEEAHARAREREDR